MSHQSDKEEPWQVQNDDPRVNDLPLIADLLEEKLFEIVYAWGRAGVVTDYKCPTFQHYIKLIKYEAIKGEGVPF